MFLVIDVACIIMMIVRFVLSGVAPNFDACRSMGWFL